MCIQIPLVYCGRALSSQKMISLPIEGVGDSVVTGSAGVAGCVTGGVIAAPSKGGEGILHRPE